MSLYDLSTTSLGQFAGNNSLRCGNKKKTFFSFSIEFPFTDLMSSCWRRCLLHWWRWVELLSALLSEGYKGGQEAGNHRDIGKRRTGGWRGNDGNWETVWTPEKKKDEGCSSYFLGVKKALLVPFRVSSLKKSARALRVFSRKKNKWLEIIFCSRIGTS